MSWTVLDRPCTCVMGRSWTDDTLAYASHHTLASDHAAAYASDHALADASNDTLAYAYRLATCHLPMPIDLRVSYNGTDLNIFHARHTLELGHDVLDIFWLILALGCLFLGYYWQVYRFENLPPPSK